MSVTSYGRIFDAANRGLRAIELARDVAGDDPGANARLDRVSESVEDARDNALLECLASPGLISELPEDCERNIRLVETVSKSAIASADGFYRRATGHGIDEVLPSPAPGDEGSTDTAAADCPFNGYCKGAALAIGSVLGILLAAV